MIFLIPVATPGTSARINMSEELYYKDIFLSIVKIIQIWVNSGSYSSFSQTFPLVHYNNGEKD